MNLIENIQRISALISEDKKGDTIRTMIDKMGVSNAIKLVGNYYTIEPYLKEIDKVNYIKERIIELGDGGGFGLVEIDEEPIHYGEDENELRQIEYLGKNGVTVAVYDADIEHMDEFNVMYESLSVEIIEQLVEILLNH